MAVIPFGEYLPDLPAYQNNGATVATNVVPLSEKSYGPFKSLKTFTAALPNRCQGAFGAKDYSGLSYLFAGDGTSLYIYGKKLLDDFFLDGFFIQRFFAQYLSSVMTWVDVSNPYHYSVGEESNWNFVQFGNMVIACCLGNRLQKYQLNIGTTVFTNLSDAAPQAKYAAVIRDFVMFGDIVGPDGVQPNLVWWPAIDDPTNWPTPGTSEAIAVQSDYQLLPEGGAINGILGAIGGADGAIILDEAIYRVTYVGTPYIFQFDKVEKVRGSVVPGSIINSGSVAFYLGIDGFYAFDGTNSIPIGHNKVDKMFYSDFDQSYYYRVTSTVDIQNKLVMWSYPGKGHIAGGPNRVIAFNWASKRWSIIEQNLEAFFRSYALGFTLDDLDTFGTMETLPYSLDSRVWAGGSLVLSGFDSAHKYGAFDGDNLDAEIETGEFDGGEGQRVFLSGVRPVVDGDSVNVAVGIRDTQSGTINYQAATTPGVDGVCPQRISSRYMRARVNITGNNWSHAQGVEPTAQADGER